MVKGHVDVLDGAVDPKDLPDVLLGDVLGEALDGDLGLHDAVAIDVHGGGGVRAA